MQPSAGSGNTTLHSVGGSGAEPLDDSIEVFDDDVMDADMLEVSKWAANFGHICLKWG